MIKFFKKPVVYIFLAAFLLRLVLSFLVYHPDVLNHLAWTQSILKNGPLEFYDRHFQDITDPNYPPLSLIFFTLAFGVYVFFHRIILWLNFVIPAFPSNLVLWFDQRTVQAAFMKFPAILADLGIGILIYAFIKKRKNSKWALVASSFFLFNPAVFYNCAAWGQIESIVGLFILAAFIFLIEHRPKASSVFMILALLVKQSAIIFLPIFILIYIKSFKIKSILFSVFSLLIIVWVLLFPFHPTNTLLWFFDFYAKSTSGVLNFAVANAYNFWALLFGFDNRPDTITFLNLPYSTWGYIIFTPILFFILARIWVKNDWPTIFWAAILITFASFCFLTRMHERYLFPLFPFLTLLLVFNRKVIWVYLILSFIHLVNLYHFWWIPKISFLIFLLDNRPSAAIFSLVTLLVFLYLLKNFAFPPSKL